MSQRSYRLETVDEFLSRGGQITRIPPGVSADQYEWASLATRIDHAPVPIGQESESARWTVGMNIASAIGESVMGAMPNDIFEE